MGAPPLSPVQAERTKWAPLINRSFARLWSGQVVTDLGTVVFNTALVVWVASVLAHGHPWAPLAVSGLLLAQSLPMVVVRPFAGVFVDRWDVRRTMLRMDAVRVALVALLLVPVTLPLAPAWQLAAVYLVVLLVSACGQFFNPALLALINDLVPEEDLPRASGLSEVTWSTASVLGPPLAAPLVLSLGIAWVLVLNAGSFAVSYVTLRAIHPPQRADRSGEGASRVLEELRDGLRFVLANHTVRTVTLAIAIAMLGAGTLHALDYFFVTESLHAAPALYGLVGLAFGGGSIVGALLAGRIAPRLGVARTFVYALLGVGVAIVVLSRQTSLAPALVVWVVFGAVNAAANVAMMPLLLGATPRALVGRMNALFFTAITVTSLLSSTLAGWLDSDVLRGFSMTLLGMRLGPVDTLLALAGLLICASGVYAAAKLYNAVGITCRDRRVA
ncbi:MAG TPA: MFS transporter [Ktedonobacterales bacterium]|nr:MFS transporter [Ktedonobacterales bacterium]